MTRRARVPNLFTITLVVLAAVVLVLNFLIILNWRHP